MRIRVNYERPYEVCFVGHLDLKKTIERGMRRSNLPVSFTEGYNKRVKLEMGFPLSVGMIGEDEYLDLFLREPVETQEIQKSLEKAFQRILIIKRLKEIDEHAKAITSFNAVLVNVLDGILKNHEFTQSKIQEIIDDIYSTKRIEVVRNGEKKDIRRFIERIFFLSQNEDKVEIMVSIFYTALGSIKISEFQTVIKDKGLEMDFESVRRVNTYVLHKANLFSPFDVE